MGMAADEKKSRLSTIVVSVATHDSPQLAQGLRIAL
jgi:hypothetical protein